MKKFIFLFALLSQFFFIDAQETIFQFYNALKTSASDIKGVIPIVNERNDDLAYFIFDAKNIYGFKIDENFKISDKIKSEDKKRTYKIIVGTSISEDNTHNVFLSNKNQTKFKISSFSFEENTTTSSEFELNSNEKFIQSINHDNKLYLITRLKIGTGLFVYTFDKNNTPRQNMVDLSNVAFFDANQQPTSLSSLLAFEGDIPKIEYGTPTSIEMSCQKVKVFQKKGTVLFTIDMSMKTTQTLSIDLNTFKADDKFFDKPVLKDDIKRSNSFYCDNYLFTIAASKKDFKTTIVDYNTSKVINEFYAEKESTINFKNTPIIQEGGMYDSYRELDKTKQFVRRLSTENIGISVLRVGNSYEVVMGSVAEVGSTGFIMPVFGGLGGVVSVMSTNIFFNPTYMSYNSFSHSKATRIETLLNFSFRHIDDEIPENAFDKINNEDFDNSNQGYTIFKYKDYFVVSYLENKIFTFYKFKA